MDLILITGSLIIIGVGMALVAAAYKIYIRVPNPNDDFGGIGRVFVSENFVVVCGTNRTQGQKQMFSAESQTVTPWQP
ncbi:hypothetical protein [Paraburkholderia aspalathi]|uniref:hypothetical protein n=1 Tax=Paraburkholderia aspalathi TaxID=1324617 RepID=UPI0038BC5148